MSQLNEVITRLENDAQFRDAWAKDPQAALIAAGAASPERATMGAQLLEGLARVPGMLKNTLFVCYKNSLFVA